MIATKRKLNNWLEEAPSGVQTIDKNNTMIRAIIILTIKSDINCQLNFSLITNQDPNNIRAIPGRIVIWIAVKSPIAINRPFNM